MPLIFEFLSFDLIGQHGQTGMQLLQSLNAGHLVGAEPHGYPMQQELEPPHRPRTPCKSVGPVPPDRRAVASASTVCDEAAKRSPCKKRPTVRGEICVTIPRL